MSHGARSVSRVVYVGGFQMKSINLQSRITASLCAFALSAGVWFIPNANAQQIEEIVVTAEKREESLQDVSISVTAFNEELLDARRDR